MVGHMPTNMVQPTMPTERDQAILFQWLSASFPIGSFSYSHGLEAAVAEGWVSDGATLMAWLTDVLEFGSGRADAIWIRLAHAAASDAECALLNAEARAFCASAERLIEAQNQGAAFAKTIRAVWQPDLPDYLLPIAFGEAVKRQMMDIDATVALYLQAFVSNLVVNATRLLPIGQTDAQHIIAELSAVALIVANSTKGGDISDISNTTLLSDVAAMRHETLDTRLFQS